MDTAPERERWTDMLRSWMRHRSGRVTLVLGLYVAGFAVWIATGAGPEAYRTAISDLAFVPIGLAGAAVTWRVGGNPAASRRLRLAWRLVGLALLTYAAGDMTWSYYELYLGIDPFPSLADVAYLLFYPLMLAGLLAFPAAPQGRSARVKFWLDATTALLGGWMIVWYFVLGPTALAADADFRTTVFSAAYPIGDLVLVFGIAALLLRQPEGANRTALGILAAGIASFLIADLMFGYLSILAAYEGGSLPDVFWMLGLWLMVAAAQFQDWRAARKPPVDAWPVERVEGVSPLPYAAIVLGYALLFIGGRTAGPTLLGGLLYATIAMTACVLLRQFTVMRENVHLLGELRTLAAIDGLTGLLNHRQFYAQGEREFTRYQRYRHPLTAIMMDIDNLKSVNDRYGHIAGDQVLQIVAGHCRQELRQVDLVARYGGDEIAILLPETELTAAALIAQRLLNSVGRSSLAFGADLLRITLSAGVADADGCPDLMALLHRADEALLRAKQGGRNVLVAAEPPQAASDPVDLQQGNAERRDKQ